VNNKSLFDEYLNELDRYLLNIPGLERVTFLNETREELVLLLQQNPDLDIEDIHGHLLLPKKRASVYCEKNGYKFRKVLNDKSKWSFGKVFVYCFLGFLCFLFLLFGAAYVRFTPLFEMKDDKVTLLGGSVVFDSLEKVFSHYEIKVGDQSQYQNSFEVDESKLKVLKINFSNARLTISNSVSQNFSYQCNASKEPSFSDMSDEVTLNLEEGLGSSCRIEVPETVLIKIHGSNGFLQFEEVANSVDLNFENGSVKFEPKLDAKYNYNLSVGSGTISEFENSNDTDTYKIKIKLNKGSIEN